MNEPNVRDIMFSTHTTALVVTPAGKGLLHDAATEVRIEDEGAGPFVVIGQEHGQVAIERGDWPAIRDAVEQLLDVCDKLGGSVDDVRPLLAHLRLAGVPVQ